MDKNILDPITLKMESGIEDNTFPGAVLLCAKDKDVLYHRAFGLADIYQNRLMNTQCIFDLASLTKPFATAISIAKMIEKGRLELKQPVSEFLYEFKGTDKSGLTIDMCLRHTTGLPPFKEYYHKLITYRNDRKNRLFEMILKEPLLNDPGTVQDYSDIGFMILGRVVEYLTRMPINQYVLKHIYAPLGINHLFYIPIKDKDKMMSEYGDLIVSTQKCPWRKKLMIGETDDDNTWAVGGVDGHAGLFGNTSSLFVICYELLKALKNQTNRLIDPQIFKQMVVHKNNHDMVAGFDTPAKVNSSAGKYFSSSSIGHLGFTGTSFWIDPVTGLIVILLTNRVHPSRANERIKKFRPELHDLIYERIFN